MEQYHSLGFVPRLIKRIKKARKAKPRLFHGNKAQQQRQRVIRAFDMVKEHVRLHEPEEYAEVERMGAAKK